MICPFCRTSGCHKMGCEIARYLRPYEARIKQLEKLLAQESRRVAFLQDELLECAPREEPTCSAT